LEQPDKLGDKASDRGIPTMELECIRPGYLSQEILLEEFCFEDALWLVEASSICRN
jgi:hypothetical protein